MEELPREGPVGGRGAGSDAEWGRGVGSATAAGFTSPTSPLASWACAAPASRLALTAPPSNTLTLRPPPRKRSRPCPPALLPHSFQLSSMPRFRFILSQIYKLFNSIYQSLRVLMFSLAFLLIQFAKPHTCLF